MIPLLFAAAVALSPPDLQKDLRAPVQRLLDAPKPPPISKDLRAPPSTLFDGKSPYVLKIAPGQALPSGAVVVGSDEQLYSGQLCRKKPIQTLGPDHGALRKLGDLPPGLLEHAVNRLVNGCPVREIVSAGGVYYLDTPVARVERADPVSYVAKTPSTER